MTNPLYGQLPSRRFIESKPQSVEKCIVRNSSKADIKCDFGAGIRYGERVHRFKEIELQRLGSPIKRYYGGKRDEDIRKGNAACCDADAGDIGS
jgi:hypothetical protein